MGSSKKHKRDSSKKHKHRSKSPRSRSRSLSPDYREKDKEREKRRHKKHKKDRERKHRHHQSAEQPKQDDYHSDSSDVVEVPLDPPVPPPAPPPPPVVTRVSVTAAAPRAATQPAASKNVPAPASTKVKAQPAVSKPMPPVAPRPSQRTVQATVPSPKTTPSQPKAAPPPPKAAPPTPPKIAPSQVVRSTPAPAPPPPPTISRKSPSPIPENGAGDSLSIEATNKLRAKLGLKPLEVGPSTSAPTSSSNQDAPRNEKTGEAYERIKDDWGEFYHKPATNIAEKTKEVKIRERLKERKEKRSVEDKLKRLKTLGERDSDDDTSAWVVKSRNQQRSKDEAAKRAKVLDQMDEDFGVDNLVELDIKNIKKQVYKDRDLHGLRVEHDVDAFTEGKQVILTLKDAEVLNEDGDTLVNVNMIDDERYKKSVENKKQNPNMYGYDVYSQEEVDEYGIPKQRNILGKYDDEIDGSRKSSFTLGESVEEEILHKRRLLEIKCKLQNKKLESLNTIPLQLASEYYTETEVASFKKPKKKIRKIRQKLKADDLVPLIGDTAAFKDIGTRRRRNERDIVITDDVPSMDEDLFNVKVEEEDDDLEQVLAKARRLKQKEAIISKALSEEIKREVKPEAMSDDESGYDKPSTDGAILLNATAEFCRTLGDIPTYGLAGNRDDEANDIMDFEHEIDEKDESIVESDPKHGTWNSVNPYAIDVDDSNDAPIDISEVAILDEEPDVASGVAGALHLAMSKGYLEKEESNRPSNTRFAHLQAKNYSIEDKSYGEENEKYNRRDRYSGPISDFKEKETFKPNVKLEYIDDNGHLLNPKEAFRYLSHKFHGKGPGKNKVEKRLKKNEQEGLMMKMSSTDTPLGTLNMLQAKQKETQSAFIVLSGSKQTTSIVKQKR